MSFRCATDFIAHLETSPELKRYMGSKRLQAIITEIDAAAEPDAALKARMKVDEDFLEFCNTVLSVVVGKTDVYKD